ncbi:hypothetical protein IFM89_001964 [Coptis chinensis]|uniref:Uncharacterized protein n=1 Tax=Coptis chinensis TaxID=261450 RepID=A0A835HKC5_9MAGN|nr:hypothetical protein IFM89_001964 [Coptis chinensis]
MTIMKTTSTLFVKGGSSGTDSDEVQSAGGSEAEDDNGDGNEPSINQNKYHIENENGNDDNDVSDGHKCRRIVRSAKDNCFSDEERG